ncbi:MAG: hypothetical protein H7274_03910, partial [Rhodoferax sp.]|nr:hypothetical protein [Rhodoferax sp.]
LAGVVLRHEVYSADGSPVADVPYRVIEHNYEVRQLQRRTPTAHAVFFVYGCETLTHDYERDPADPRVSHSLTLAMGEAGEVVQAATVIYGRKLADPALPAAVTEDQQRQCVTCAEFAYTPDIDALVPVPAYRLRQSWQTRGAELTGVAPAANWFSAGELRAHLAAATPLEYEDVAAGPGPQLRLLSRTRALFRDNALAPLPPGQWDTLGLAFESYTLAHTPGILATHYHGRLSATRLAEAGFVELDADGYWWIPSGTELFPPNPRQHFFLPSGVRDPLGLETRFTLDADDLLLETISLTGAAWSTVRASNDYRVLAPFMRTDPNQNRHAVAFNELGMVVASAAMGRSGAGEGDTLADPSVRMEYDLFNWMNNGKPNVGHVFSRERHADPVSPWQESYLHLNGSGQVAMVKLRVHPGKASQRQADGSVVEVDADPRWIGNGRTICNNKGSVVKQYQPFFSTTHEYDTEEALQKVGVTPIHYYDPLGRLVRTRFANGTEARVRFDSWKQQLFDAGDTVLGSDWYAERGSPDPLAESEPLADPERRAAWLAACHANTPATIHFDSGGRVAYALADHGGGVSAATRIRSDLTGRFAAVFDPLGREVSSGFAGMDGPVMESSAEKGRRWVFCDVLGATRAVWDEHGREARVVYDALHRAVSQVALAPGAAPVTLQHIVYGDRHPDGAARRLLGALHLLFDQAGLVRIPEADFKGNPVRAERLLARAYSGATDWSAVAALAGYDDIMPAATPQLHADEVFGTAATYDALNRPLQVTLPDASVIVPSYNRGGFLSRLRAQPGGQGAFIDFLADQDVDANGQRLFARFGNGMLTRYFRDPLTFRLASLVTAPQGADPATEALQNIAYTYDAVGNLVELRDRAQDSRFFANASVGANARFTYDALSQLVRATGRELAGPTNDGPRNHTDFDLIARLPHPNNGQALRSYSEEY